MTSISVKRCKPRPVKSFNGTVSFSVANRAVDAGSDDCINSEEPVTHQ
jgi:hypothetical protein